MPIARKIDKDIPKDFLNQVHSNLKKTTTVIEEEQPMRASVVPEPVEGQQQISTQPPKAFETTSASALTPKTDKYADVMNIRLSKGRRNEIKAFCSSNGIWRSHITSNLSN